MQCSLAASAGCSASPCGPAADPASRPAILLGWIASPPHRTGALTTAKRLGDRGSLGSDQLALAILIETGRYDATSDGCGPIVQHAATLWPGRSPGTPPSVLLTGLAAGFHVAAHLPAGAAEQEMIRAARNARSGCTG
jgi:GntR family transcriptional regulator / MocR family aminotransferase